MALKPDCSPPVNEPAPREELSNGLYLIQNKASGLCLSSASYDLDDPIVLRERSVNNPHQMWHMFKLNIYSWLIVNRTSGLCLTSDIESKRTVKQSCLTIGESWGDERQWAVHPDRSSPDFHTLSTVGLHQFLALRDDGEPSVDHKSDVDPSTAVNPKPGAGNDHRLWKLVRVGDYRVEPEEQFHQASFDVYRLTSLEAPPETTEEVLVGRSPIPFPMIDDPDRTVKQQSSAESPFYMLRHFECMRCSYFAVQSGLSRGRTTERMDVRIIGNPSMVERVIGFRLGDAGCFHIPGVPSVLHNDIVRKLNFSLALSGSEATTTHEKGTQTAMAFWYREHRFELRRSDGSVALEWTVVDPTYSFMDVYQSPEVAPPPCGVGTPHPMDGH